MSFLSQNLLGTLSANLLFPKVKTAPDSDRKTTCEESNKAISDERICQSDNEFIVLRYKRIKIFVDSAS